MFKVNTFRLFFYLEKFQMNNSHFSDSNRDPKYYSDPEQFKPERFNEEEQRNRHKGTYLGFGEGKQVC